MAMTKIDSEGHYTNFPGVTVISSIRDDDLAFWLKIYNCLAADELLTQYYSPLPCFSYHMTTTNLFVKSGYSEEEWVKFIDETSPLCLRFNNLLKMRQFTPTIAFGEIITAGVIQLVVTLPLEQEALIRSIAKEVGMSRGLPSFFHITLAYEYKPAPLSVENLIQARLQERLGMMFIMKPKGLSLNPPQLCSFDDMTSFKPWDGRVTSLFPSHHMSPVFFSQQEQEIKDEKSGFEFMRK